MARYARCALIWCISGTDPKDSTTGESNACIHRTVSSSTCRSEVSEVCDIPVGTQPTDKVAALEEIADKSGVIQIRMDRGNTYPRVKVSRQTLTDTPTSHLDSILCCWSGDTVLHCSTVLHWQALLPLSKRELDMVIFQKTLKKTFLVTLNKYVY